MPVRRNRRPSEPQIKGRRVAQRREELNLTQMELASKLRWNQSKVSLVERERLDILCVSLVELAEALGVSTDWLLGLSKHKERR